MFRPPCHTSLRLCIHACIHTYCTEREGEKEGDVARVMLEIASRPCTNLTFAVFVWRPDRFCGRIVSWGPKFHGVEVLGEDVGSLMITNSEFQMSGDMSTHDYYDGVARCVPVIYSCYVLLIPS